MSTIRISKKDARVCKDLFASIYRYRALSPHELETKARLEFALKPRSKPMPVHKKREVADRRAAKNAETAAIREAVARRAGLLCECGCGRPFTELNPMELDHFWGRGKAPQTVENCWGLGRFCHGLKTRNFPSAAVWLDDFATHAERHGYTNEAAKARRRLESLALSAQSAEAGKGGGR